MAKKRKKQSVWAGLALSILVIVGAMIGATTWNSNGQEDGAASGISAHGAGLEVRFLDVGQADSSLILLPNGKTMLIDAGGNSTADALVEYLKGEDISKLDYVVGTHPHEDHIGGLDKVIEQFEIGALYLPKVDDSQVPTTRTYEDVLTAIADKGLSIHRGKAGTILFEEDGLTASMLAPGGDRYDGLNSYSIAVRLEYGSKSFLFMGDAESDSEEEILSHFAVKSDVLKCGHHGSSTSTSKPFLRAVQPQYAVISCGKDNSYGHPHRETLSALKQNQAEVYRTDQAGTITCYSDGSTLSISGGGPSIRS